MPERRFSISVIIQSEPIPMLESLIRGTYYRGAGALNISGEVKRLLAKPPGTTPRCRDSRALEGHEALSDTISGP